MTGLIRDAMTVAQGQIPDLAALVARARKAQRQADDISAGPELRAELIASIRATPLDPARPALDLLENLLSGIHGCWLIFSEYTDLVVRCRYQCSTAAALSGAETSRFVRMKL